MSKHTFIRAFDGPWHVSKVRELRGDKTGEVLHRFIVTACREQQIGGPWGHTTWRHEHNPRPVCKHCQKLLDKEWQAGCDEFIAFRRNAR